MTVDVFAADEQKDEPVDTIRWVRQAKAVLEDEELKREGPALAQRLLMATQLPAGFEETVYAAGVDAPIGMEFAPDGRLFVTQKGGQVRVITPSGTLLPTPFLSVAVNTFVIEPIR